MVELIGGPDRLAQGKIARQHDVFPAERDDQSTLHGPRADARDRGQLGHQLIIGQTGQGVRVQPAVRQPPGEITERADLPPGQPGLAQLIGIGVQQLGGRGQPPAVQGLDAGQRVPGCCDRQLLADDLKQQGTEEVMGGSWAIQARGSKSGRSSISRASTASACRRRSRACSSPAAWPVSAVTGSMVPVSDTRW
jgi:hypothetical protein